MGIDFTVRFAAAAQQALYRRNHAVGGKLAKVFDAAREGTDFLLSFRSSALYGVINALTGVNVYGDEGCGRDITPALAKQIGEALQEWHDKALAVMPGLPSGYAHFINTDTGEARCAYADPRGYVIPHGWVAADMVAAVAAMLQTPHMKEAYAC